MKILIIGSKGFIGSYVYSYYIQNNNNVVIGCDVVTDYQDQKYIQIDATNSDYHSVFENNDFEICINCSGAASVPLSLKFPLKDYILNTVNVFKILEAIKIYEPKCKFLNLSSAAVYGNPEILPIKENVALKPLSPYGIHKMQAEQICKEFYEFYNISTCSLRIFSAYGNGLKKQLFWDMYHKFKNNNELELFGTGNETRDFIHIEDILQAINLVIKQNVFFGGSINIANGEELTIKHVARTFKKELNSKKEIKFNQDAKQGDPINWKADISVIEAMGYKKTITLEQGIKKYIQWVKELQ